MTYLNIARRGKNNLWRYIVIWPLIAILVMVIALALIIPPLLLHWIDKAFLYGMQTPSTPVPFYVGAGITFGSILLATIIAARLLHGKRFTDLIGAWTWPDFALGLGIWLVVILIGTGIDYGLHPHDFRLTIGSLTGPVIAAAIGGLAIQTFTEEFVFRGYLTQAVLLATKNPWVTSVITGVLFGALHIPNGIPQAVGALAFGIVMARIAIHTGSLAFGYGVHLINNLFGGLVVVSADDIFHGSPAVFSQHTPDLMWLDVGFELVALAVLCVIVLRRKAAD